jgi:hypothetical protein
MNVLLGAIYAHMCQRRTCINKFFNTFTHGGGAIHIISCTHHQLYIINWNTSIGTRHQLYTSSIVLIINCTHHQLYIINWNTSIGTHHQLYASSIIHHQLHASSWWRSCTSSVSICKVLVSGHPVKNSPPCQPKVSFNFAQAYLCTHPTIP